MTTLSILNQSPIFLMGLDNLFANNPSFHVVFTASKVCQFWQSMYQNAPDVVLLDSHFADLCPIIKQKYGTTTKILLFGTSTDAKKMKSFFAAGATGFTLQTVEPNALIDAVERTAKGELYVHPDLISAYLCPKSNPRTLCDGLTKREQEILNLIVEEQTTQQIAAQLYISSATVETHRHHLISKLGVKNTAGLVREAMRAVM